MKKAIVPTVLIAALALILAAAVEVPTYIGAQKCAMCHKTTGQGLQFPKWEASGHSKAYASLNSEQAIQAGQAMGIDKPAADPKCLKCHGPLADKAPDIKAEGVSCEVCHGPGSIYKSVSMMKDPEEAAKNGLILYANADAIKASCLKCHENAHGKSFDFAAAVEKIKHPIPR